MPDENKSLISQTFRAFKKTSDNENEDNSPDWRQRYFNSNTTSFLFVSRNEIEKLGRNPKSEIFFQRAKAIQQAYLYFKDSFFLFSSPSLV